MYIACGKTACANFGASNKISQYFARYTKSRYYIYDLLDRCMFICLASFLDKIGWDLILSHIASSSNWFGEEYLMDWSKVVSACSKRFNDFDTEVGSKNATETD